MKKTPFCHDPSALFLVNHYCYDPELTHPVTSQSAI